jgi:hypothetical protein
METMNTVCYKAGVSVWRILSLHLNAVLIIVVISVGSELMGGLLSPRAIALLSLVGLPGVMLHIYSLRRDRAIRLCLSDGRIVIEHDGRVVAYTEGEIEKIYIHGLGFVRTGVPIHNYDAFFYYRLVPKKGGAVVFTCATLPSKTLLKRYLPQTKLQPVLTPWLFLRMPVIEDAE